jgi:PAS domain-containing protein
MILSDELNKLLYHSAFACYVKDREGRYLYINDTGAKMLGRTPLEILGRDDSLFFTRDGHHIIAKEDAMTYYASSPVTYISHAKAASLQSHPDFRAIKRKLQGPKGKSEALVGVAIYDDPSNPIQPEMIRTMHQVLAQSAEFERAIRAWDAARSLSL